MATLIRVNMKTMLKIQSMNYSGFIVRKWGLFVPFVFVLLSASVSAHSDTDADKQPGPSFNCAKVTRGTEKIICDSRELSQLDLDLSKAYKAAKAIDPSIKHEQRLWIKQRNKCKGEKQQACLKKSYRSRTEALQLTIKRGIRIPTGWEHFVQSKWLNILNKECYFKGNEEYIRYVNHTKLGDGAELLTVACMLGAYQDSHLVYLLRKYENTLYAKQVTFIRPVYEGEWKVFLTEKIVGNLRFIDSTQTLTTLSRSSGLGTCGYVVSYSVSDLYQAKPLKPVGLKGENDCEKGIAPEDWPDILLPLPLTTGSNEW